MAEFFFSKLAESFNFSTGRIIQFFQQAESYIVKRSFGLKFKMVFGRIVLYSKKHQVPSTLLHKWILKKHPRNARSTTTTTAHDPDIPDPQTSQPSSTSSASQNPSNYLHHRKTGLHERPNRHHRSSQSGHKVDTPKIP
jgi:hypothetical protein